MVTCSVIVPFQKGKNYLRDCLNSILAQNIPDLEVILVLDHAEDVGDIIEEYSKELTLIPAAVSGSGGVAEARNLGLRSANGEYIYFLDSDDYILDGSLAALYQKAEAMRADIATGCLQEVWFKRDSFLKMREEGNATKVEGETHTLPGNPLKRIREDGFSVGNLFIRKSYLAEKGTTFVEKLLYYSDLPFVLELLSGTSRVVMAEEAVYLKRMHNDAIHLPALDQIEDERRPEQFVESYRLGLRHAYKSITLKEQLQLYFLEHIGEKFAGNVHAEVFSWSPEVKNAYRECLRDIPKELMRGRMFSEKRMFRAFARGKDAKAKFLSRYVMLRKRKTGMFGSREQRRRLIYILFFRKKPVRENWIVFESFLGRYYSDSCRALYEYILEHYPNRYKCIWAINEKERRKDVKGKPVIVKRGSIRYYFYVSQAKYWVNNMRQDIWLDKKPGMVFLETWHGTPLKRLFFDMEDVHSDGYRYKMEMYRQSRKWDYLLSDNPFSTEVFSSAFLFPKEKILEYGYPRNDILYAQDREERAEKLKERLGLPRNKKVILYAPTWRDDDYYGPGQYKFTLALDLGRMQKEFGETHCILVRTHHYIADRLDLQDYEGFAFNVSGYGDISELYLLTDICITDYSSVFFDFANLRRPILFYAYDMEKYRDMLRGFYIDMETELPGPLLYTNDEVIYALRHLEEIKEQYREKEEAFYQRFCSVDDGNACKRIYEKVFQAETEFSMEEIQASLLEMMKVFHRVCEENNIAYYMNSGTVLGAIRHKGFIPWDDDVDLGLYREEYEKLLALPEEVWGKHYRLATFHNTEGYPFCYAKLYDMRTTKVENAYGFKKWVGGIYLDIFPHDGAGNSRFGAVVRYRRNFIRLWFLLYSLPENRQRNPIKRILQRMARRKTVFERQCALERAMQVKSAAESRYVSNYIGKHRTKEVFDKSLFGKPTLYSFADTRFYGPEKADEYLSQLYGNYMEFPPEGERETAHPGEVDLKHSFLEK